MMADQKEEIRREREESRREIAQVDSRVGRLLAAAIVALASVAFLLLVFGNRTPATPPSGATGEPTPTTPAPPATPKAR
jgi:hypothetical protein